MQFHDATKKTLAVDGALSTNAKGNTSLSISMLGQGQGQARAVNHDGSEVYVLVSIREVTPSAQDFVSLAGSAVGKTQSKSIRLNLLTTSAAGFSDDTLKFLAKLSPSDLSLDLTKTNSVKKRSWINGRLSTISVKVVVTGTSRVYSAEVQSKKIASIVSSYERKALQASIIFDAQAEVSKQNAGKASKTAKILRTVRSS